MKKFKQIWNLPGAMGRFKKDRSGQFTVFITLASVVVLFTCGVAVDSARLSSAKTKLNNAIDAAVLATTRDLTAGIIAEDEAEESVRSFIAANLDNGVLAGSEFNIDSIVLNQFDNSVEVAAHIMLPMTLTAVTGWNEVKVESTAKAVYGSSYMEIVFVLDATYSMNDPMDSSTRMAALKESAKSAIDSILPDGSTSDRIRIGLVPYSTSVNISSVIHNVQVDGTSLGCVVERTENKRWTDDVTTLSRRVIGVNSTDPVYCASSEIVPLTNNKATLLSAIDGIVPDGWTAGHVGIGWAYYMLSSKWNAVWPGDQSTGSDPAPSSDPNTKKFAIIMTDGAFNAFLSSGTHKLGTQQSSNKSKNYAKKFCTNMKGDGITIFTINFAGGSEAEELMEDCASPNTGINNFFFDAQNSAELESSYQSIGNAIMTLRLAN